MPPVPRPPNDTEQPLGDRDATIQVTYIPLGDLDENERPPAGEALTALLTVRAKDQDLTESQLREVGDACLRTADRMREDAADTSSPR